MIRFIRIFLFVLILIGLALLFTQNLWVPKVVDALLAQEAAAHSTTYTNAEYGFTLTYPKDPRLEVNKIGSIGRVLATLGCTTDSLICLSYPSSLMPHTSFGGEMLSVNTVKTNASTNAPIQSTADCYANHADQKSIDTTTLNGTTFKTFYASNGASQVEDEVHFWTTYHNGTCFDIRVLAEKNDTLTGALAAPSPPASTTAQITNTLAHIISSFTFTK